MNYFFSKKLNKGVFSLVIVLVYFSIQEIYSQPPLKIIFKKDNKTDSLVNHSAMVKNTLSDVIRIREDMEKIQDFQVQDQDSILKADEYYKMAIQKADEGDVNAAKSLENVAILKYQSVIINNLLNGLTTNVERELEASRNIIGPEKYAKSKQDLSAVEKSIKQYSLKNTTYPVFLNNINGWIKNIFGNLGIVQIVPAYLVLGEFTVLVDTIHVQVDYIHGYWFFSGTGRIKFCCDKLCNIVQPIYTIDTSGIRSTTGVNSFNLTVVNKITYPDKEILLNDARLIDPSAKTGNIISVDLSANKNLSKEIIQAKDNLLNNLKQPYSEGILVKFDKLKVVTSGMQNIGIVTAGFAYYPTLPPDPKVPIIISLPSNFTLAIDSLLLSTSSCIAKARIYLPNSLTSGKNFSAAWLDLGLIYIKSNCEFYKELPGNSFGPIEIGTTTMNISGRGYIVDFSSTKSYTSVTPNASWKGVILLNGQTSGTKDTVVSNIGYLQAKYNFTNALITSSGIKATFNSYLPYDYITLQPSGFEIKFDTALVNVDSSEVMGGYLKGGSVNIPKTAVVDSNGLQIKTNFALLYIFRNRSIYGNVKTPNVLVWGELTKTRLHAYLLDLNTKIPGFIYFPGQPRAPYLPASGSTFNEKIAPYSYVYVDSINLCGITYIYPNLFAILTPDVPDTTKPLSFIRLGSSWINILSDDVNACINGYGPTDTSKLGPVNSPQYACPGNAFTLLRWPHTFCPKPPICGNIGDTTEKFKIKMDFVESAVFTSNLNGYIKLNGPSKINLAFKDMLFTSTAQNAGGKVDFSTQDTLSYWGVEVVQRAGFSSSGLVCVKTGQIILNSSGLYEPRHYSAPFYLTWGEMLATGDMGRLFFDYANSGQQFDGFNFAPFTIALSKYDTSNHYGFLKAAGEVYFPFFGGDYFNINDWKYTNSSNPYNNREIKLDDSTDYNTNPSDTIINGTWADNFGKFKYSLKYNSSDQNGFMGIGTAILQYVSGGDIASTVVLKSAEQLICIKDKDTTHGLTFGPIANSDASDNVKHQSLSSLVNFGNTDNLWGCASIVNDQINGFVLGGEISTYGNASVAIRSADNLTFTFSLSPTVSQLTLDGTAFLSLVASLDLEANGHFSLTVDRASEFLDGDISAKFKVSAVLSSPVEADGDINWHFENENDTCPYSQSLQGILSLNVLGISAQGGFYFGYNAPKSKAWVLAGADPRYKLNTSAMPDYLTGVYGFVQYGEGFDFFLFSGGFDVFAGAGIFFLSPGQAANLHAKPSGLTIPVIPYIVGNLGGGIHGEILAGFVSASATIDLQIIAPYPGSFEGTVSLEGCVLWIACKSVDLTVGLNTSDGLYIR